MTTPPTRTFDPRALTEPVDRSAVRAYARQLKQAGWVANRTVTPLIIAGIIVAPFLLFFVAASLVAGLDIAVSASGAWGAFGALTSLLIPIGVIGGIAIVVIIVVRGASGHGERWYRLARFAHANGLRYLPGQRGTALPGMIFGRGRNARSDDILRGEQPRFVEFANYRYEVGSGKNRRTHSWGYVAVRLDTALPHIVLDATGNNGMWGSNLPVAFEGGQRLSLEGDFDRYFTLYCPQDYATDALYLFTPDIMARFIDNAAQLDVEIVDDWLFLYSKNAFSTLDPRTWAWLFSVVGALLDKLTQWDRWRDDRLRSTAAWAPTPDTTDATAGSGASGGPAATGVAHSMPAAAGGEGPVIRPPTSLHPPRGVAAGGRRLRRRIPVATIVIIAAIVVFWLLFQAGGLAALFG